MIQQAVRAKVRLSLYINYFVFAILLNSVGIVILKSQKVYGVDELAASTLELFKDMPMAIVSFIMASFLPRIGYKNSMLIGLGLRTLITGNRQCFTLIFSKFYILFHPALLVGDGLVSEYQLLPELFC